MKRLVILMSLLSSAAMGASYSIDNAHSDVGFKVQHLMISKVKGRFDKFEGSFNFDEAKKELSAVNIKVDMKSVDTNDKKRNDHLMSPDFFDAAKFPEMTFKTDKPVALTGKTVSVPGTLTLHGVSKPLTLEVEYGGSAIDPMGSHRVAFSAHGKLNRKDFGVNWNKSLDKGGVAVSEEVEINIDGEAIEATAKK